MKNLFILFLFMCMLLAFLYCCKKLGLDIGALLTGRSNTTPPPVFQASVPLHKLYNFEYQACAGMVWNCLKAVKIKDFDLTDRTISNIFCKNGYDRVKKFGPGYVFIYEIPVSNLGSISNGKVRVKEIDYKKIEGILQDNLPEYMCNGYYYTGNVHAYYAEDDCVLIEVQGVGRQYQNPNAGGIVI